MNYELLSEIDQNTVGIIWLSDSSKQFNEEITQTLDYVFDGSLTMPKEKASNQMYLLEGTNFNKPLLLAALPIDSKLNDNTKLFLSILDKRTMHIEMGEAIKKIVVISNQSKKGINDFTEKYFFSDWDMQTFSF